ncbi:SDR family oxidoreductase [Aeromicrobium tamlense]|uniref:NAD(P)-dependent dehydrogenase (Short-subunit alcohol dehydrogenase family) n=1 Tax=Aeromicrobium tamlense TaxID=375541 RepID=A0A8I0FXG8_9ACTN|nr:SDR family oxidoreductase [Aeromicrobium tamlense]MBD1270760.1 SDR family oxidoreductase [Aeromicrobium tamlense]MBD1271108.1 SDR family oxidoreductase [Aeromicrobium tamlense]NYI38152.1 NAD(P)-dependent dehydrogenase (short-subunit alcohol dehydrogenase family) [Aeromicrobium tamlense]
MDRIKGRVAVVTGSSSGIGRQIAMTYAREGAKVVVSDLNEAPRAEGYEGSEAATTVEAIRQAGGEASFVRCDVTSKAEIDALVDHAVETYGRLDVFVNNAGMLPARKLLHEYTEAEWEISVGVNAKGTFFGMQAAVRQFLSQGNGGVIVNIVSTGGLQGHPGVSVYNAAKGAAAQLTKCAAVEYGPEQIRINGICPTNVQTALMRDSYDNPESSEAFTSTLPLQRWGRPTDIADLALFLASDESSFIHGALVPIDGGEILGRYSV